jgi:hypothetical protein
MTLLKAIMDLGLMVAELLVNALCVMILFHIRILIRALCDWNAVANRVRKRRGGDRWDCNDPFLSEELGSAINKQAMPHLSSVHSLADFVTMAKQTPLHNPHTLRAIAFALGLDKKAQEAISVIDDLIPRIDPQSAWQIELGEMAKSVRAKLIESPEGARQQLLDWEAANICHLKLA